MGGEVLSQTFKQIHNNIKWKHKMKYRTQIKILNVLFTEHSDKLYCPLIALSCMFINVKSILQTLPDIFNEISIEL